MRDEGFSFIGFMVIFLVAAVLVSAVQAGLAQPEVIGGITAVSPWAGQHAELLSWISEGIIIIAAIAIPLIFHVP